MEGDKEQIQNWFKITRVICRAHYGEVPFIEFYFNVFNMALTPVSVDDSISDGRILFYKNNQDGELVLRRAPTIENNFVKNCQFRGTSGFMVRQDVTPEEAAFIQRQGDDSFFYVGLKITMHGDGFSNVRLGDNFIVPRNGTYPGNHPASIFEAADTEVRSKEDSLLERQVSTLAAERDELKAQLEKLSADALPKLTFEISAPESQVKIDGSTAVCRINATVKLRCLKTRDGQMAVRDFHASLHKQEGTEPVVTLIPKEAIRVILGMPNMKGYKFKNGWIINEPLTDYRSFMFCLEILPKDKVTLSRATFLRITMDVVGQTPISREFYVDSWAAAMDSNSSITLRQNVL